MEQVTVPTSLQNNVSAKSVMTIEPRSQSICHGTTDRFAFWLFLAMMALCPLPDGSVDLNWIAIWTGCAAVVILCASYRDLSLGAGLLIGVLFVVVAAYILVAFLQSVSPGLLPLAIWSETATLLGEPIPPLSSSVRDSPLIFLGRPLLAALVLMAGIIFGSDRRRASLLFLVVVGTACIYGAIGLIALNFSVEALRPYDQGGSLTTFFVSKNTTATYLGSAFLVAIVLTTRSLRGRLTGQENLLSLLGKPANRRLTLMIGAAFFLLVLLPLTKSRAGVILTLLLALAIFYFSLRGAIRSRGAVTVVALGIFALTYVVSGDDWRVHQARAGFESAMRVDAYVAQLEAISEHPWLGLGLGSFAEAFPQYRTPEYSLAGLFNIGHSTPLELAFEGGLPLLFMAAAFTLLCAVVLVRGLRRQPRDPYILAGLLVGILGMVHSSIDFSLQIPGYLIIYMAIVGIGIGQALMADETVLARRRTRSSTH